ncbi:hypothetical protein DV737_g2442, partial [Chaetothyriales sp. CBS 132003]
MPEKRAADTYLTDRGEESAANAEGATPVKMATAAQLARRKYVYLDVLARALDGAAAWRVARLATPLGAAVDAQFQQPPQSQQVFGSVGGITFGAQSKSFPPDNYTSSGFNFTAPSQNNPFASMSNPFANPNGNASFGDSTTSSAPPVFGAPFGMQNGDDVSMESPEKKQRPSSVFGQPQQQNQVPTQPAPAPLFQFGASASSTATPAQPPNGLNGLFAKPAEAAEKTDQGPRPSNVFGLSTGATAGAFGASQPSATFQFGAASSSAPTSSAPPLFGGATSAASQPLAGPATPFKFGGATATTQSTPALNLGATTAPATAPAKAPFNLFANNPAA